MTRPRTSPSRSDPNFVRPSTDARNRGGPVSTTPTTSSIVRSPQRTFVPSPSLESRAFDAGGTKATLRRDPIRTYGGRRESARGNRADGRDRGVVAFGLGGTSGVGETRDQRGRGRGSAGLTIGGIGDHTAGIVRFGRDGGRPSIDASLFFSHGDRRHVCRLGCHDYAGLGRSWFGRGYYPCYGNRYFPAYSYYPYYGSYSYLPLFWPGYASSYTSVYYDSPMYDVGTVDYGSPVSSSDYSAPQRSAEYIGPSAEPVPVAPSEPVPPSESATPQIDAEQARLLDQGDEAFAAGRFDDASRWYVSAMLADGKDGVAAMLYSLSNVARGDYQVAAAALRRAIETTPELMDNPIDVRRLYSHASQFETHRDDLAAFVDDHPEDRDAKLLLGYVFFASGDAERARMVFEAVAASDPADEQAARLAKATAKIVQQNESKPNP